MQVIWDEVFLTGKFDPPENNGYEKAVATALSGWGACHMSKPPEKFGEGMAALANYCGHAMHGERLNQAYEEIMSRKA